MELRRVLLRIMLAALGIAAVAGMLGVFVAATNTMWRIAATATATAIATGLMLRSSMLMDKPKLRRGGLAQMAWTLGAYLLANGLIWPDWHFSPWPQLALTLWWWFVCGIPLVMFLTYAFLDSFAVAAWTGVVLAALVFALMEIGTWLHSAAWLDTGNWYATGGQLAAFGGVALACLVHSLMADRRWWRWLGIAAATLGFVIATVGIWENVYGHVGERVVIGCITFAAVVGLFNLTLLVPLAGYQILLRWLTLAAGVICAAAINLLVVTGASGGDNVYARAVMGSGIVVGCGSLALVIMARLNRHGDAEPSQDFSQIVVVCPRCHRKQPVKLGGAKCVGCQLRIDVTVEEPRCPRCGYLLYMLTSARCPECGTPISTEPQA